MAFSRFSRFRGRAFGRVSRGFRPRNRLSNPQRTKGLEMATFFFEDTVTLENSSNTTLSIYTVLASMPMSLGNASSSPENRVGTVLQSMNRYIQINGVVYDYGVSESFLDGEQTPEFSDYWFCHQLFTDRVEYNASDVAFPATIGSYDPFDTNFPVANLTTTSPEFNQRQGVQPTRVHLSRTRHRKAAANLITDTTEGALYYPAHQQVDIREPTVNKRLRIRVDDNHGLFFGWFFRTSTSWAIPDVSDRFLKRWARGQIYFRFRQ